MLPELDSRRQPEFAMEHSMGRQGGAGGRGQLCARCAARTLARPSVCARALPPGRPLGLLPSRPRPPRPLAALLRREARQASGAPLPGAPCPGGDAGESARENVAGEAVCARERGRGGRESGTLEPPVRCLQRAVRVRV